MLEVDTTAYNPNPPVKYDNQEIVFTGNAWTIGTIVSKEFGLKSVSISLFAGINYARSAVTLKFSGNYPLVVPNDEFSPAHPQVAKIQPVSDPISFRSSLSNMRVNVGFRVKLALVTISAEYNLGKYNTMSVGIGLNMQSLRPVQI